MSSPPKEKVPVLDLDKAGVPEFKSPIKAMGDVIWWLEAHWLNIAIALGAAIVIYTVLGLLRGLGKRICRREDATGLTLVVGRAIARTSHPFMALCAARLVVRYARAPDWLTETVTFLFTIFAVFQAAIWAREIVLGLIERRADPESGHGAIANAMGIIRLLVTVALFAIAAVVVLDNIGVNVTGLVAGLGIGGIAIGLAAQGIFADLFAALAVIFDKPFKQGETITYDTTTATVERIGLKSTRLRAVTGERKIISNTQLLSKELTNLAGLNRRRIKFPIGVVYQTPVDVAERLPDILREEVERAGGTFVRSGMVNFGASSLDFEVEFDVFADNWDAVYVVRHKVAIAILRRLNDDRVEIAYPTQTTFTAAPDGRMIMPYPEHLDSLVESGLKA